MRRRFWSPNPCLYIPLAMEREKYADCYEWIKDELKNVDVPYIEMVKSADELAAKNMNDFGAIIFGKDLEACQLDDANEVNLNETNGFDILNGISILCHYTNRTVEKDEKSKQYLLGVSKYRTVVALPEEVTLFVNCGNIEVIGNRPYYFFENGVITKQNGE